MEHVQAYRQAEYRLAERAARRREGLRGAAAIRLRVRKANHAQRRH